jgi:hypothetical protein
LGFWNFGDEPWHVGEDDAITKWLNRTCIAFPEEALISLKSGKSPSPSVEAG